MVEIITVAEKIHREGAITLKRCLLYLSIFIGCKTVLGVSKGLSKTARNIRDILGVGRDIENISK